ncbi:hypothetical protein HYS82_01985 [Candidatus Amesbacteria bacterium]|nr:hypothetical protein [Candidatus Amesbacteria bacterium]MBI2587537.1 hypothetical protein [Candidatus Amesbacteria bacterium]
MLDKRLHVLVDKDDFGQLELMAVSSGVTVSEQVRKLVKRGISSARSSGLDARKKLWNKHLNWRKNLRTKIKGPPLTTEEILGLVREGRKYE